MNEATKKLAADILIATISAHYHHGLQPGQKLNMKQVCGEAVEAALTFDLTVQAEEEHKAVTKVMQVNNAFSQGFVCGVSNDSEALAALINQSPEFQDSFQRGWDRAKQERAEQGGRAH